MANLLVSWKRYSKQSVRTLAIGSICVTKSSSTRGKPLTGLGGPFAKGSAIQIERITPSSTTAETLATVVEWLANSDLTKFKVDDVTKLSVGQTISFSVSDEVSSANTGKIISAIDTTDKIVTLTTPVTTALATGSLVLEGGYTYTPVDSVTNDAAEYVVASDFAVGGTRLEAYVVRDTDADNIKS